MGQGGALQGFGAGFAGADAHHLLQHGDENLAVANLSGAGGVFDGLDDQLNLAGLDGAGTSTARHSSPGRNSSLSIA